MEERRTYSVVNSPIQLRLLAIVLGILLVVITMGGAYVWSLLDSLSRLQSLQVVSLDQWLNGLYYRGYVALFTIALTIFIGLFLLIRATHRIVGPLFRLKRELKQMREDDELHLVTIRDPDRIHDFVRELNQLLRDVEYPDEDEQ